MHASALAKDNAAAHLTALPQRLRLWRVRAPPRDDIVWLAVAQGLLLTAAQAK